MDLYMIIAVDKIKFFNGLNMGFFLRRVQSRSNFKMFSFN